MTGFRIRAGKYKMILGPVTKSNKVLTYQKDTGDNLKGFLLTKWGTI